MNKYKFLTSLVIEASKRIRKLQIGNDYTRPDKNNDLIPLAVPGIRGKGLESLRNIGAFEIHSEGISILAFIFDENLQHTGKNNKPKYTKVKVYYTDEYSVQVSKVLGGLKLMKENSLRFELDLLEREKEVKQ